MKRLKYIAFTVLLASFSLQSCDLERYPLTDLSEDNFWTDDKNAELALTSLYRGSITNGLEYSVSDFWSYHGMLFMEHLTMLMTVVEKIIHSLIFLVVNC